MSKKSFKKSKSIAIIGIIVFVLSLFLVVIAAQQKQQTHSTAAASGPLKVSTVNPRYFTDGSGKAVYLTGSHTWGNFTDYLTGHPPFDYAAYLNFLTSHNHNFFRLWSGYVLGHKQAPYVRTGPGTALDGQPRVNLSQFDQVYFDRLRSHVIAARDRGIYVGVMLFAPEGAKREDLSIQLFNPSNNTEGINADTNGDGSAAEAYDLSIPKITQIQEAYVRKVVDTLHDLDNVLYEIGNEGDITSVQWQYHMIRLIKTYEGGKPKQHPVGMTAVFDWVGGTAAVSDAPLVNSPADWISPSDSSYKSDPPVADGSKVIITDVDHIWPAEPQPAWIWRTFLRGHQPIHMDSYTYFDHPDWTGITAADQDAMRKYMGYTLTYARKMNLAAMTPQGNLSSTLYALVSPSAEYLVYQPGSGAFTVNLGQGTYDVEWFNSASAQTTLSGSVNGGSTQTFTPPFSGEAVLYLKNTTITGVPASPTTVQPTFACIGSCPTASPAPKPSGTASPVPSISVSTNPSFPTLAPTNPHPSSQLPLNPQPTSGIPLPEEVSPMGQLLQLILETIKRILELLQGLRQ